MCRRFFPPAAEEAPDNSKDGKTESAEDNKQEDRAAKLPDAPTAEPEEEGQPEAKKLKATHEGSGELQE